MRPRGLHVVIGAMGIALILLAGMWWSVTSAGRDRDAAFRQLSATVGDLRQELSAQRRLAQALRSQVIHCRRHPHDCQRPLPAAPTDQSPPRSQGQPMGSPSSAEPRNEPRSQPRPTRTPRPTSTPHPTSSPTPSPSPSHICLLRVCLPPLGAFYFRF